MSQVAATEDTHYIESTPKSVRFSEGSNVLVTPSSSVRSNSSSGGRSSSTKSPSLRANLTRQHNDRNPLGNYEIIQLLGAGSMGSVAKVRKKPSAVGRSARLDKKQVQKKKQQEQEQQVICFKLLGGLFSNCFEEKNDSSSIHNAIADVSNHSSTAVTADSTTTGCSSSQQIFAMKSIHLKYIKDKSLMEELKNEVQMLKTLDHPHIVRVLETFSYRQQLWVVMELCSGGDLYTRDPYTEEQAARICSAMCAALTYMHSKGILHRDLKYENILFVDDSPEAEVKLIDFGLSKPFENGQHLTEGAGTIYTMAPEVLKGKYTKQADLWSVGVIAYMLLSSQMPFFGQNRRIIVNKILEGEYTFSGRRWKRISNQAKVFVDDLLVMDPDDRATAEEALRASWLNRRHDASVRNPHSEEIANVAKSIKRFVGYSKLRKVALMVVAHKSTSAEIGPILRKFFQLYDRNGSGQMNFETFKEALMEAGYSDENHQEIFDAINMDGTGSISYTEFIAATIESTGPISEVRLAEAFDRVDHDDKGYISVGNLKYLLGNDFPEEEIRDIMSEAGSNDGIPYSKFLAQFTDNQDTVQRQQNQLIQKVMVARQSRLNETVDQISELTESGDVASLNFVEGKFVSERKGLDFSASSEPKSVEALDAMKKAMLQGDVAQPIEAS